MNSSPSSGVLPPHQSSFLTNDAPVFGSYFVSFHAPVPAGTLSSVVPATYALGVISVCALKTDTRYGKLPFALRSLNTTVFASLAVAPPGPRTPLRPELPAATRRSIVATTSSAVNGDPSCHLTFWRRSNVHSVPSVLGVHFSASPGPMSTRLFGVSAHRNSKDWEVMPYPPRSCIATGSILTGFCAATRIVPPVTAGALAAALPPALAAAD